MFDTKLQPEVCIRLVGSITQENDATASSADASRLKDVISRCNALGSERAKNNFSTKNLEQDLIRLLRSGNAEQHRDVLDRPLASAALSGAPTSPSLLMILTQCAASCKPEAPAFNLKLNRAANGSEGCSEFYKTAGKADLVLRL